ncbi:hypothetical protein WJX73_000114 [Symbiochloris irregularis]|uniref:C-factor n=1 Tax=Symbiochloris irregularis TaxID=706552 RepID=A0AAW1PRK3_9CHLO
MAPRRASQPARAFKLENQRIAVVGSSRGIGLEFAKQLLARNNEVFAAARDLEGARDLQALGKDGSKIHLGQCDTTSLESIKAWVEQTAKQTDKLDTVFNVAGKASWGSLMEVDPEELLSLFTVNAVGPLMVVQHLLKAGLLKQGSLVANLTSKMGAMSDNTSGGTYAYRASKASLNAITKSLSLDLQDKGITACVLHPGWVQTEMVGMRGLITTEESVRGMLNVLEAEGTAINGRMIDYKHDEIGW